MLEVKGLKKTFKMSKKQQKIEKTKEKIKVAVADVSFDARPGGNPWNPWRKRRRKNPQRSEF